MPAKNSKMVVREYIESVWNHNDGDALLSLTSESFTYHLGSQPPRDRTAMEQFVKQVHEAFPDWRVSIEEITGDDDAVAVRWAGQVTHEGAFHGIPPTGKTISVSGINFYKVEGDRIAREWEQMDSLGMLQQLGALS